MVDVEPTAPMTDSVEAGLSKTAKTWLNVFREARGEGGQALETAVR